VNTKLVNSAAGVILAALTQNRTSAGVALALESAGLLMTPETAVELASLRARAAELEAGRAEAVAVSETLSRALHDEMLAGSALYAALTMPTTPEQRQAALDRFAAVAQRIGTKGAPHVSTAAAEGITWRTAPTQALREAAPLIVDADGSEPVPLRWGLNDVQWGDDDSVIVMLSGPDGEPYWLELEADRAAVLRTDLAGPDQTCTDYAVTRLEVASEYDEGANK
jgi:hypothetical protein